MSDLPEVPLDIPRIQQKIEAAACAQVQNAMGQARADLTSSIRDSIATIGNSLGITLLMEFNENLSGRMIIERLLAADILQIRSDESAPVTPKDFDPWLITQTISRLEDSMVALADSALEQAIAGMAREEEPFDLPF